MPATNPGHASKLDCRLVELKLFAQLFEFDHAPTLEGTALEIVQATLGHDPVAGTYICPLSGRHLDFEELVETTDRHPQHGRSAFAVGHQQPTGHATHAGQHTPDNVVWVHEQGNRVQGNLSVEEATDEVFRIADFHRRRRGLEWDAVEAIAQQRPPAPEEQVIGEPEAEPI